MPLPRALQRFQQLDLRQRAWLIVFLGALPVIKASLRLRGYARTREMVERWTEHAGKRRPSRMDVIAADQLARLAQIAGRRGLVKATCLPQALAVYAAVRRRGLDPVFHIGIKKSDQKFEAHAWVELAEYPLAQPELDHLRLPLDRMGGPAVEA
jgi:hypothetical protein